MPAILTLSRSGELHLLNVPDADQDASSLPSHVLKAFEQNADLGLLHLGLMPGRAGTAPEMIFWQDFSRLFFYHFCLLPGISESLEIDADLLPPPSEDLKRIAEAAPLGAALEGMSVELLESRWRALISTLQSELNRTGKSLQAYFELNGSVWNLMGRVCFHLAENKGNEETPFAFLATYSHKVSAQGKAQHLPLGRALQEYAGQQNKERFLQLLLPVRKAAKGSAFLKGMVDRAEIYHPLAWTASEAYQFLKDIPVFEAAGVIVRVPDWWNAKKPPRPQVSVTIGGKKNVSLGLNALLDFKTAVTLDGETLTEKELREILSGRSGLALIRGKWVEIDREKLGEVLAHWKAIEKSVGEDGISFVDGMRLLSGISIGANEGEEALAGASAEWSQVTPSDALLQQLERLREPDGKLKQSLSFGSELHATLRPYQRVGVQWLWLLHQLGLGGCLADDMGLGKTLQIISLLLLIKREKKDRAAPSLLVVPASLLGNWKSELEKFAPSLQYFIAHPSVEVARGARAGQRAAPDFDKTDVVITTYGYLGRLSWLSETSWNLLVIDEAQAIKNAGSKQTKAVKSLKSRHRIALTGTPVENHLSDLWSLYDFLCPGLLGSAKEFERFVKAAAKSESTAPYAGLRNLIKPYLLRRLKTDRRIITDLPEKTELPAFCSLTKTQAALYQQSVEELTQKIEQVEGIQRRGVVLAFLMRFKQICNHPSQWLTDQRFDPGESGKFARLRELCEEIAARREKVLIFTQFREMTGPLSDFLTQVFGKPGLVLHGETAVKKRNELVDAFQDEWGPPFFVLSLKAGGTGLNLTAANHVIHFDRWWNPAVENQATDRAFRIGQKKNVLVHKFICRGTVEERINALISEKQNISNEILDGSGEAMLTELSNAELLKLVSLDIRVASPEE
jgi:non-specific serine/threonine protein kinase